QTNVWLPKNQDISCAIIGKFTQRNKVEEKCLTHWVVIDEKELDFLIQDCIKEGTYAGSDKCPLGHILIYYECYQPQYTYLRASMLAYAYINLLEMLQRFSSNEVVRIATDSIYIRKEALYKIENVFAFFKQANQLHSNLPKNNSKNTNKFLYSYCFSIPCTICERRYFPSLYPIQLFTCADCFSDWYYHQGFWKESSSTVLNVNKCDKDEKIHGPDPNVVYWLKGKHWESRRWFWQNNMRNPNLQRYNMVVFTHTNVLAKDFQNNHKNGVEEWIPERMGEKKFPRVVIWDEPPLFFGEMPHDWLKEQADYYEELSDRILSAHILSWKIASQKCLKIHQVKYPEIPIPLIYRPKDRRKQNCLVQIPGSSEKKELVKNDIIYLPLNTLPDKFLKDILVNKKVIDWELGYAMTIHTSQGMTLKLLQHVWVIDENLAWDNLIYLAVGRIKYLSQLIRIEAPPLSSEIAQEIEEAKKKKWLEYELRPSIQKKLIRYMGQDKEKGCEFDLTVDYILTLKHIQEDKCALCLIEMKFK
ncbi:20545_t:CDS:2, partial [Racocetra persica]